MSEFWALNKESIALASIIALVTGPLWAIGHEATKWLIYYIKAKFQK